MELNKQMFADLPDSSSIHNQTVNYYLSVRVPCFLSLFNLENYPSRYE